MTRRQSCRLIIVPITLKDARAFVAQHHRHHEPGTHGLFAVAVAREGAEDVAGVAIVSRPSARMLCDGWTAEVTRCATDGTPNGCSALYGAAWRAARALGYRRLVTYTLKSEGGGVDGGERMAPRRGMRRRIMVSEDAPAGRSPSAAGKDPMGA